MAVPSGMPEDLGNFAVGLPAEVGELDGPPLVVGQQSSAARTRSAVTSAVAISSTSGALTATAPHLARPGAGAGFLAAHVVDGAPVGQRPEPRAQAAAVGSNAAGSLPEADEHVLAHVLGGAGVADDPQREPVDERGVLVVDLGRAPRRRSLDQPLADVVLPVARRRRRGAAVGMTISCLPSARDSPWPRSWITRRRDSSSVQSGAGTDRRPEAGEHHQRRRAPSTRGARRRAPGPTSWRGRRPTTRRRPPPRAGTRRTIVSGGLAAGPARHRQGEDRRRSAKNGGNTERNEPPAVATPLPAPEPGPDRPAVAGDRRGAGRVRGGVTDREADEPGEHALGGVEHDHERAPAPCRGRASC